MNKRELRKFIKECIEKRFDKSDVNELLSEKFEQELITKEQWEDGIKIFAEESENIEEVKIGFFQKRRLKKGLKKLRELIEKSNKEIAKIMKQEKALNRNQRLEIERLKEKMIGAIIGDKKKGIDGLNEIFDVRDEDGKEIAEEEIRKYSIDDLSELLEELVDALEKEI